MSKNEELLARVAKDAADTAVKNASGEYRIDKAESAGKASVWAVIGGIGAPAALALAGWAHTTLWAHEGRITTIEARGVAEEKQMMEFKQTINGKFDEIRDSLRRMEDKLDRKHDAP